MRRRDLLSTSGGVSTFLGFDTAKDPWVVHKTQDVEPVLDRNKALITEGHDGYTPSGDLRQVASVPTVVYESWMQEFCKAEGLKHFGNRDHARWKKFLKSKLNNDDNKFFRTVEGKL